MAWGEDRRGTPITLCAIHTNEGDNPPHLYPDRTAENLADWLTRENNAGRHKSYHAIVDDDSAVEFVPDHLASWAMRSGNLRSLNLCFTGWARWSRAEWLAHPAMLARGAAKVRHWCAVHGLPVRKLSGTQIRVGYWGVCGHGDWSDSDLDDSTHTDPGPNFPWDVFVDLVAEDDMTPDQARMLAEVHHELTKQHPSRSEYATDPPPTDTLAGGALNADGRAHEVLTELRQLRAALPGMFAEEIRSALATGVLDVDITVTNKAKE